MIRIPMTDLKPQYQSIKDEIDSAIRRVIESGQFVLGQEVDTFEADVARYCGTKWAVGVASGTDSLHLALLACGVGPGDEVITTPFTFIATAESIVKCGATPVFADIDPKTYNIDPVGVASMVTTRTKAILPVHLYGQPASMQPILDVARAKHVRIIEDCAQALGAEYRGKRVGSLGDAGCLSFFPAKNLGAYGDGGMVVTNDDEIADSVKLLRGHGAKTSYYHVAHGFNSRLDALQAAVLGAKLKHLDHWNEMRRTNASRYSSLVNGLGWAEPQCLGEQTVSSCNYYTLRLTSKAIDRNRLREYLSSKGIQTNVYYPLSLHLQEVYRYLGYATGSFPEAEMAQNQVISLPMYPELTANQVDEVVDEMRRFAAL